MQTPAGRRVSPDSRRREEPRLSVSRRLRPLCLRAPHPQCNPPLANLPVSARVPASEFSARGNADPCWPVCQLRPTIGSVTIHLHLLVSPPPLLLNRERRTSVREHRLRVLPRNGRTLLPGRVRW
ncbi:hypothetical protein ALC57_11381 [Trachymyrmex cornetzi]|uniref:Uncharacterized protein n=1 Tax=Trachymyrmex cornetzi TaxID=471704 RepID=A0A151J2U0_9HYME|nr:hypothetical protein ALC57_11381 [Trachymyrmex cornetzi]